MLKRKPSKRRENKLRRQGYENVAGLDEAGRGAWAGPLVAAAVILPPGFRLKGLRDSKQLSPKTREELFVTITKNAVQYAVSIISHKIIDKIGIQQANIQGFRRAIQKLSHKPGYLLLDGRELISHPLPYEYIVSGDALVTSIAAASIIAKVTRDHIMADFDRTYPDYGFAYNKGYGTFEHLRAVKELGPCSIHRVSFRPLH